MQPSGRTSTGAPILTLADQQRQREENARIEAEFLAQQQAQMEAQRQNQPPAQMQPVGGTPGNVDQILRQFPGSAPGAPSGGLLSDTLRAIGGFFTPDKKLGEMVPASENPLMSRPGVGIGGEARRRQIDELEEEAVRGQRRR